jgi:hypothetical protein
MIKNFGWFSICVAILMSGFWTACGENKDEKVKNGVMYAKNALEQAGTNPFSRATYEGIVGRGGNPADYIKAITPKENAVFDSYEFKNPTRPYTVVIRPGTVPNEYFVEGYGKELKEPIMVETVTVTVPTEQ